MLGRKTVTIKLQTDKFNKSVLMLKSEIKSPQPMSTKALVNMDQYDMESM